MKDISLFSTSLYVDSRHTIKLRLVVYFSVPAVQPRDIHIGMHISLTKYSSHPNPIKHRRPIVALNPIDLKSDDSDQRSISVSSSCNLYSTDFCHPTETAIFFRIVGLKKRAKPLLMFVLNK